MQASEINDQNYDADINIGAIVHSVKIVLMDILELAKPPSKYHMSITLWTNCHFLHTLNWVLFGKEMKYIASTCKTLHRPIVMVFVTTFVH